MFRTTLTRRAPSGSTKLRTRRNANLTSNSGTKTEWAKAYSLGPKSAIIAIAIVFTLAIYRDLTESALIVEPFAVPDSISALGYSGSVIAARIAGAVIKYRESIISRPGILSNFGHAIRNNGVAIDVEAGGYSSRKISSWIAYGLGLQNRHATGEATVSNGTIVLTWRLSQHTYETSAALGDIDDAIAKIALSIVRVTDPYIHALDVIDSQPELSIAIARDLAKLDDDNLRPWAINLWGVALAKLGRHPEALEKFSETIKVADKTLYDTMDRRSVRAAAHINIGVYMMSARGIDAPDAITHFKTAVALAPDYVYPRIYIGDSLADAGKYEEAIHEYSRAIEVNPKCAYCYLRRGQTYERRSLLITATTTTTTTTNDQQLMSSDLVSAKLRDEIAKTGINLCVNPTLGFTRTAGVWTICDEDKRKGYVLHSEGSALMIYSKVELSNAIDDLQTSVALDPGSAEALYALGVLRKKQGNCSEAVKVFERLAHRFVNSTLRAKAQQHTSECVTSNRAHSSL